MYFDYDALRYSDFYEKAELAFEYRNYRCFLAFGATGCLCGYVALPKGHPLQGVSYDALSHVDVHGGLTFSEDICASMLSSCWVLGFDCAHSGDRPLRPPHSNLSDIYPEEDHAWTHSEVANECRSLVRQIEGILQTACLMTPICPLLTTHCSNDYDMGSLRTWESIAGLTQDLAFAEGLRQALGEHAVSEVPEAAAALAGQWVDKPVVGKEAMERLEATADIWKSKGFGSLGVVLDAGAHFKEGDLYETCRMWADNLGITAMLDAYASNVPVADIIA